MTDKVDAKVYKIAGYTFHDVKGAGKGKFSEDDQVDVVSSDGKAHRMSKGEFLDFLSQNDIKTSGMDGASYKKLKLQLKKQAKKFLPDAKAVSKYLCLKPESIEQAISEERIAPSDESLPLSLYEEIGGRVECFSFSTQFEYFLNDTKDMGALKLLKEQGYAVTKLGYAIKRDKLSSDVDGFISKISQLSVRDKRNLKHRIMREIRPSFIK